jgi:polyhydroxyalkanoate synthase
MNPSPDPAAPHPTASHPTVASRASTDLDRLLHAAIARVVAGVSPVSIAQARADWAAHLALSPDKQQQLVAAAADGAAELTRWLARGANEHERPFRPEPRDTRFRDPLWGLWPFSLYEQTFLAAESWWHRATTGVRGVTRHHEDLVAFFARQWLDLASPSNAWCTNPEVLAKAMRLGGLNFLSGLANWLEDAARDAVDQPPVGAERYRPGIEVAVTPGKVVLRNRLIELIQYEPATPDVFAEPVLLVPAWIMKYYILDLSPHDSLVKHLVDHGHTVFAISWKNPDRDDRDLSFDDYRELGLMAALEAVHAIVAGRRVHAVGYCLGGTLLAIGAAAMARDRDDRLASLTFLAAQTDFTEPGELGLFVDESQLTFLEDLMSRQGYLTGRQMGATFQLLRSVDLVWSRAVHEYLIGERAPMADLMAWNADGTRMPARMHAEYLRSLYLNNDLAAGRFRVGGKPIALADLHPPMFAVGTTSDHVAPWRSVYKLNLLTDAEVTFVLTTGGHNAGVVNPPGDSRRSFRIVTRAFGGTYLDPDAFLRQAEERPGSWWPAWLAWLEARSSGRQAPPPLGRAGTGAIADAPGSYVLVR